MQRVIGFWMLVILPASTCFAGPAAPYSDISVPEKKASVELVIPFGGPRDNPDYKPRLQLSFDTRLPRSLRASQGIQPSDQFRKSTIGFTLASNPNLYVNGRQFAATGQHFNISTLGWVGIGAGVLLAGGAVLLADAIKDSECCE